MNKIKNCLTVLLIISAIGIVAEPVSAEYYAPGTGKVSISANIPNAEIWDTISCSTYLIAPCPLKMSMNPADGAYTYPVIANNIPDGMVVTYIIAKPNYESYTQSVRVLGGKTVYINAVLKPKSGNPTFVPPTLSRLWAVILSWLKLS